MGLALAARVKVRVRVGIRVRVRVNSWLVVGVAGGGAPFGPAFSVSLRSASGPSACKHRCRSVGREGWVERVREWDIECTARARIDAGAWTRVAYEREQCSAREAHRVCPAQTRIP